jgi:hypothetical protein
VALAQHVRNFGGLFSLKDGTMQSETLVQHIRKFSRFFGLKEDVPQSATLEQAVSIFQGIRNPMLFLFFRGLPYIIISVIIYCVSQKDWILVPGVLALLLTFMAFQYLLRRIPRVLGTLWQHRLVAFRHSPSQVDAQTNPAGTIIGQNLETEYTKFVDEFEARLNRRYQWLLGLIFASGWLGILVSGLALFYRNTPMLASGIKGKRIQLRFGSELPGSIFMRRRLGCPVCLQRGAPPPFHSEGRCFIIRA